MLTRDKYNKVFSLHVFDRLIPINTPVILISLYRNIKGYVSGHRVNRRRMSSGMTDSTQVSLVEEEDEDGIVVLYRTQLSSKFNSWHRKSNLQNDYML